MPGTTTRHALPYPVGSDLAGTGDATLQSLADAMDTKLDIATYSASNMRVARNLCSYKEHAPNLPGYVIIQTNMTFGNYMTSLNIRGYLYQNVGNIVDLTINFYAYNPDQSIVNATVSNRGSAQFSEALILRKDSDGKVAIALKPTTTSNYWHYPHLWVDGMFAHTDITVATLKTGWLINRAPTTTGYTTKATLAVGWQTIATGSMLNSWTHFDTVRIPQYMKTGDGWVHFRGIIKDGTITQPAFIMPVGFRPEITTFYENHIPGVFNSAFGYFGINGTTGGVIPNSGSNGYVDLSSIWYKAAPV